jgi:hypothetical protein
LDGGGYADGRTCHHQRNRHHSSRITISRLLGIHTSGLRLYRHRTIRALPYAIELLKMDPVSITGLVGACANLAKLTITGLQSAYNAQQQCSNIQSSVTSLLSKLNSISFSLGLLKTWSSHSVNAHLSPALLPHLKSTITSCEIVIFGYQRQNQAG